MDAEQFQQIINGGDIWLVCGIMVVLSVVQSLFFMRNALKEANHISLSKQQCSRAIRAASISAVGPSLSPIVVSLTMITIMGAPDTWLSLCNVGAARTDLATIAMGTGLAGVNEMSNNIGLSAWDFALWACALNGAGWMIVTFLLTHRMQGISDKLYARFDAALVSTLMNAAVTSLFAYLLANQLVGKGWENLCAAAVSAVSMLVLSYLSRKSEFLKEISLGVSMLAGMFVTQALV